MCSSDLRGARSSSATTEIYTLSLHDALPIYCVGMGPCGLEHDLGRGNRTLELVRRIRDETTLRVHRRLDSRKQIVKGSGEAREVPVLDMVCPYNASPLQVAASKGHLALVKRLIELGADLSYKDKYGERAYHYALRNKQKAVAEYIKSVEPEIGRAHV